MDKESKAIKAEGVFNERLNTMFELIRECKSLSDRIYIQISGISTEPEISDLKNAPPQSEPTTVIDKLDCFISGMSSLKYDLGDHVNRLEKLTGK